MLRRAVAAGPVRLPIRDADAVQLISPSRPAGPAKASLLAAPGQLGAAAVPVAV